MVAVMFTIFIDIILSLNTLKQYLYLRQTLEVYSLIFMIGLSA